jgi:hypothetical protein
LAGNSISRLGIERTENVMNVIHREASVARLLLATGILRLECARRTVVVVMGKMVMPFSYPSAIVKPMSPIVVLIVNVQRDEAAVVSMILVARDIVLPSIRRAVVVAKIQVMAMGTHEQMQQ